MIKPQLALWIALLGIQGFASDDIILRRVPDINASPSNYTMSILRASLEATYDDYGPYTLRYADREMMRSRTFNEMREGLLVNVADTPITEHWSDDLIRIPIPVQRGILSYRLFLVTEDNKDLLASVKTVKNLKPIPQGTGSQWAITEVLRHHDFLITEAMTKKSLMNMLAAKRFAIYGRGINEIFDEVKRYKETHPNIVVDQHIALYTYLPTYFHVSPKNPRIAERIEVGMGIINSNGIYQTIFMQHHEQAINNAKLHDRTILVLNANEHDVHWKNDLRFLYTLPGMHE